MNDEGSRTGEFTPVDHQPVAYRPVTRDDLDDGNPIVLHRLMRLVAEDTKITRELLVKDVSPRLGRIERDQIELRGDVKKLEVAQSNLTVAVADLSTRVRGLEGTDQSLLVRVSNLETQTSGLMQRIERQQTQPLLTITDPHHHRPVPQVARRSSFALRQVAVVSILTAMTIASVAATFLALR
jgi:hypothetical protein